MPRYLICSIWAGSLLLGVPTTSTAQAVRGRLLGADSAVVAGAIVALVDSTGASSGRVLSSAIGSYLLRGPRDGSYHVRVLRIGYPAFDSPLLHLRAGALVEFSPLLPSDPIVLSDIDVSGGGAACRADTALGGTTATLLEEVRKAFGSLDLALTDHELRFEVQQYVRRVDRHSVVVAQDSGVETISSWPIHSLPAELLRDKGFVQPWDSVDANYLPFGVTSGRIWFGPDAGTLVAGPFLATHCYRIRRSDRDPDLLGLTFDPVAGRHLPDIAGTLWLRRGSLALERLEYHYVNLPRQYRDVKDGTGGTMQFLRLPAGVWIVAQWDLRAPVEETTNNIPVGVAGFLDAGGRITHIRTRQGAPVFQ